MKGSVLFNEIPIIIDNSNAIIENEPEDEVRLFKV